GREEQRRAWTHGRSWWRRSLILPNLYRHRHPCQRGPRAELAGTGLLSRPERPAVTRPAWNPPTRGAPGSYPTASGGRSRLRFATPRTPRALPPSARARPGSPASAPPTPPSPRPPAPHAAARRTPRRTPRARSARLPASDGPP